MLSSSPQLTYLSTQQVTYQELESAYLALRHRHQELLVEIEQRNGALGEKILECMRLIHELSLLHQEEDRVQVQQDVISHTADQTGQPLNQYTILCAPLDFVVSYSSGLSSRRRPASERVTTRDLLVRQLGQAFYRDPSLTSSSFNGAWQSVSSS